MSRLFFAGQFSKKYLEDNSVDIKERSNCCDSFFIYRTKSEDGIDQLNYRIFFVNIFHLSIKKFIFTRKKFNKIIDSTLLASESERIKNWVSNYRTSDSKSKNSQMLIIGLPLQLNPEAIEYCLSYLHGNEVNIPSENFR